MNYFRMRVLFPSLSVIAIVPVSMSLLRPFLSGTNAYIWMNWNLFLGVLPLLFAWLYVKRVGTHLMFQWVWLLAWLFFLPNAPYMITDFIHMADVGPKDILWYDALMLFSYAFVGMLSWLSSTYAIYQNIKYKSFIPVISLLTAFGVYLGRYIRFNTWDILTKPGDILSTVFDTIINPLAYDPLLLFVSVFWVFLMAIYLGYASFTRE